MGEDLQLRRDPVGLLLVLAVGFGGNRRVVGRLRAEMAVGLVEAADAVRLIVDAARDVFDVLHVRPGRRTWNFNMCCGHAFNVSYLQILF